MLMDLIKKGAEADIFLTNWDGKKAILKARKKKNYRNHILDEKIRKQRTIRESQIISDVKSFGISTPLVYFVDTKKYTILMQHISGTLVRDMSKSKIIELCIEIGKIVGLLHKNGIIHGDLTTSNFIFSKKSNSIHFHRRSINEFCLSMKTYGECNLPILINRYPQYKSLTKDKKLNLYRH